MRLSAVSLARLLPDLRFLINVVIKQRSAILRSCQTRIFSPVHLPSFAILILIFTLTTFCAPSRDTVLSDVERNYRSTGFLDTNTFQIRCILGEGAARLTDCHLMMVEALVEYKENYDREAFARRMHQDFLPFVKPDEVTEAERAAWRAFFAGLIDGKTRVVFEARSGEKYEGTLRLRLKDLIYRVQRAS